MTADIELSGTLDKIVFHNSENGYTVFRFNLEDKDEALTAVGHMANPEVGFCLKLTGEFITNPRFGRQFQVNSYEQIMPATVQGIKLYLSSGLIKGIGPVTAEKIVKKFGKNALKILDEEPDKLLEIQGISPKKLEQIKTCWQEHHGIRDLMLFLQPHDISAATAIRIYRYYGQNSLAIVKENPYRLAMDIHGIGFLSADAFAQKLGFGRDNPLRAQAATLYTLLKLTDEGHVYYPLESLITITAEKLDIDQQAVKEALEQLRLEERTIVEDLDGVEAVYLAHLHRYETKLSYYLHRILNSPKSIRFLKPEEAVATVISRLNMDLAPEQIEAVRTSASAKVMTLTGGPGTGKTTIVNGIIELFADAKAKILLAAPTGRAAKRMSETSGREARTIHRLLEYSPKEDAFARNENNPLACGLLVVDEASMMDIMLAYHLLKAVPAGATVVFVGDINQLPSVGPGNVLKDFIASKAMPVVELIEVFRQAAESEIIMSAYKINKGEVPYLESSKDRLSDFYFLRQNEPEKTAETIVDLVQNHIPRRFGLDSVEDIQVLTPMHKGVIGANSLNTLLQQALGRKGGLYLQRGERQFRMGDKVMQIRNNYDKDVFNGDIGRVSFIDPEDKSLSVKFDERIVPYASDELDELVMAYAISIHKSQGSEYPAVVIPVSTQHFVMLQRNLIYTGITRGKKLVVLVGENKALAMAVKNNKMHKRYTYLAKRLNPNLE